MASDLTFSVDKGVPLPPIGKHRKFYGFEQFNVGDSAFLPLTGADIDRCRQAVSHWGRRKSQKFATRSVVENGVAGLRVWRVI